MDKKTVEDFGSFKATLAEAVDEDGLRPTARAVGMSASGLRLILDTDRIPYARTQHAVKAWATRRHAGERAREVREALDVLLREVNPARRLALEKSILEAISTARPTAASPRGTTKQCELCGEVVRRD